MSSISGIILAAGQSSRLRPLTNDRPKSMLPIGDRLIIDWQLQSLESIGIRDVFITVGYRKEMIMSHVKATYPHLNVQFIENDRYAETNTLFSLQKVLKNYEGDFYYLNADVMFDTTILELLSKQTGSGGFLAIERKLCGEEEVKVLVKKINAVVEVGKHVDPKVSAGEFIGIAKFTGSFARMFRENVVKQATVDNEMKYFEHALDTMEDKTGLYALDITGNRCVEIDFPEDYQNALNKFVSGEKLSCMSLQK